MACLDLVISVNTAPLHLAGALGRPVWALLPWRADWRWLVGRSDSRWYATARLFRQFAPGDWPGVARNVADALAQLVVAGSMRDRADALVDDSSGADALVDDSGADALVDDRGADALDGDIDDQGRPLGHSRATSAASSVYL